jgi:3-phosphoshikimate 1-carboxyvinyltransferase
MSAPREIPTGGVAAGRLRPPPSKSVSHRMLNLSLLAGRPARLLRPLVAEDTGHFFAALERLGWAVELANDELRLCPPRSAPRAAELFVGNAGTLFRFLTATLTVLPGRFLLDGTPRLRERPVGPLVTALRQLGANIECPRAEGFAPLVIHGQSLRGGRTRLDAGESSQYLSAILMAGTRATEPCEIEIAALTSAPYVEVTRHALARFGAAEAVTANPSGFRVRPTPLAPRYPLAIEGDFSAAAYPAAAAALTGGTVELAGLDPASAQGDRGFLEVLEQMGAEVRWQSERLFVTGRRLVAVDVDLSATPDQVPTLAALAAFARGTTRIRGVAHLRIKESDRLAAMVEGFGRLGLAAEETPDGLVIPGTWADGPIPTDPATIDPHGDHRIAMAFALVGLRRAGVRIADPEVVAKSYPGFWRDFERAMGGRASASVEAAWNTYFLSEPRATDDLLSERASQQQPERESL